MRPKRCKECGKILRDQNKSGLCSCHLNRTFQTKCNKRYEKKKADEFITEKPEWLDPEGKNRKEVKKFSNEKE